MIVELTESKKPSKRFCVTLDTGKLYAFGYKNGKTYVDHINKRRRHNYWKRHSANRTKHILISNLVPSPALCSAMLLWGPSISLEKYIQNLNQL